MSSEAALVQFTLCWKIGWAQFKELPTKDAHKYFVTACKNVALQWRAVVSCQLKDTEATKFSFYLYYLEGPVAELEGFNYSVDLMKSYKIISEWKTSETSAKFNLMRKNGRGWLNFDERNVQAFQTKHNLSEADPFYIRITTKIPISIFSFSENFPPSLASASWSHTCFQQIEDPEKALSLFSNAKLISKEGRIFYCHEVVVGRQSEVFSAMFRHPKGRNTKQGEYNFPALSTNGLRALLEFLYTGQATLTNIATKEILETADAAEQYGLKILKQMCVAHLWKRVVDKPEDCFIVVRFSDLHDDWKYLKHRAMDVLTENFENMGLQAMNLATQFGGGERGERLRMEFTLYENRRLEPFSP